MFNGPSQLLHRDQDLSQTRIDHRLARVQARDPRDNLLVFENELQHVFEHLATLQEARCRPLDLCSFGSRNGAIDAIRGGRVDATQGLSSRGSVALDERGTGNLCTVNSQILVH